MDRLGDRPGDINGDGQIDRRDLDTLLTLVRNSNLFDQLSPEDQRILDLNRDGQLNDTDVSHLLRTMMTLATGEPEIQACLTRLRGKLQNS